MACVGEGTAPSGENPHSRDHTYLVITVEHPRLVADRIIRFARIVGREDVIAGADCGFAQVDTIQRIHPTVMWAKFESLVEGARITTKELWGR